MSAVLGIETSCDETGVGIVVDGVLRANAIASSVEEHARYGGVVPEVASRAHVEAMLPMLRAACAEAGLALADLDAVAVTEGPGLAGALLVGVAAAKALATGLGIPLYGVHHLAAHVAVDTLEHGPLPEGTVGLLVSGGHSSLVDVRDVAAPVVLGQTLDDAAGEAFDKIARLLGLGFPGGPAVDAIAATGDRGAIAFPRGMHDDGSYDFSFSGLKTAVARWVAGAAGADGIGGAGGVGVGGVGGVPIADVAASFQEAVVDVLTAKAVTACRDRGADTLVIGGGVAANSRLRSLAAERCSAAGIRLRIPRPGLCTDNGAMVAALGHLLLTRGAAPSASILGARSTYPLPR